jgi:hypothetical protein
MSLHSPNLTNFKGGIFMSKKITFLVLALIVVFSFSLVAEPMNMQKEATSLKATREYIPGAVYIANNFNYRSTYPSCFTHVAVAPGGNVCLWYARGTTTSNYHGFYCYYSYDYGVSFNQSPATGPAITPASYYERIYSSMELGSSALSYAVYTANNIRVPGAGGGNLRDTIVFCADLSGLGAGDWFSTPAVDNNDGSYRYMGNVEVVADTAIYIAIMDLNGDVWVEASFDYGFTWSEIAHLDLASGAPLEGGNVLAFNNYDIPKIIYRPIADEFVMIVDCDIDIERTYTDTLGVVITDTMNGAAGIAYMISTNECVTWSTPQWIYPNAVPTGFGNTLDIYYWYMWDAEILPNDNIVLAHIHETPDAAGACGKMFGVVYDGTNWTSTMLSPDNAWDDLFWNSAAQVDVTTGSDNSVYVTWNEYAGVLCATLDTAYITLAGASHNGTSWGSAVALDSTHIKWSLINASAELDDNDDVNIGIVFGGNTDGDTNDSLHFVKINKSKYLLGIAEKKHTSVTKLDLTAPGLVRNSTTIRFSVANGGYGKLDVFDISGKLVKTLVNGNVNAGNHSVTWNRTDNNNVSVSGGVYFYKLTVGNETVTRKIVAIK